MNQIIDGDALTVLRSLPTGHVQTVVTSPPYYGLRDYQTEVIVPAHADMLDCPHEWIALPQESQFKAHCKLCNSFKRDQQIGLEETPAAYVAKLVEVFREVKRVLRDDGTAWLNLGDSYVANKTGSIGTTHSERMSIGTLTAGSQRPDKKPIDGLKPKDLMMIPARVAIALCDDGWYLRSDIIWHKTNAMPESVKDRPTKAHEYVFLLSKQERYFYDGDAIKEPAARPGEISTFGSNKGRSYTPDETDPNYRYGKEQWGRTTISANERNKRSVWSISTTPFPGSHFAVMPPKLAETCILAGSRPGDIVLDPFSGAGTTAYVANRLGRRYLGIELNPTYADMSRERLAQLALEVAG